MASSCQKVGPCGLFTRTKPCAQSVPELSRHRHSTRLRYITNQHIQSKHQTKQTQQNQQLQASQLWCILLGFQDLRTVCQLFRVFRIEPPKLVFTFGASQISAPRHLPQNPRACEHPAPWTRHRRPWAASERRAKTGCWTRRPGANFRGKPGGQPGVSFRSARCGQLVPFFLGEGSSLNSSN